MTCHSAFFEQCPNFDVVFLVTPDGAKRIELHKAENIKLRIMKDL
jgi:hypothetical protein